MAEVFIKTLFLDVLLTNFQIVLFVKIFFKPHQTISGYKPENWPLANIWFEHSSTKKKNFFQKNIDSLNFII